MFFYAVAFHFAHQRFCALSQIGPANFTYRFTFPHCLVLHHPKPRALLGKYGNQLLVSCRPNNIFRHNDFPGNKPICSLLHYHGMNGVERKQPADSLAAGLCIAGGRLLVEQLPEYRIDIILIADMLHSKVIEHRLQMFILPPQSLVRAAGDFDIAVVTHDG